MFRLLTYNIQHGGEGRIDAIAAVIEASKLRLRAILMTSFAFIAGVIPLMLGGGAGAEMRQALDPHGLAVEDFEDFGPVQYFRDRFIAGWDVVRAAIAEVRQGATAALADH